MHKEYVSSWEAKYRGKLPRPVTDSQIYRDGKQVLRVYPINNDDESHRLEPIWASTGYYQAAGGSLRRKDGKKIRKRA